jgi:Endoplasmic reticulum vesicle transporter
MHISPMDGLSKIIMTLSNVLENSISKVDRANFSYKDILQSQSHEGCNLAGFIQVNKVNGNFHIAPGRSFQINGMHVHDTVFPRHIFLTIE